MNDPDETVILSLPSADLTADDGSEEPAWDQDASPVSEQRAQADPGLASLAFITTSLRRSVRFLCVMGLVGLVLGIGLLEAIPPKYQAAGSVYLTNDPNAEPLDAITTDQTLAQSATVAERVIQQLGLRQTVAKVQSSYTVTIATNEVLDITASASSANGAVDLENAVIKQFLGFRASMLQTQQQLAFKVQNQQISQAVQSLNSTKNQITTVEGKLSAQPDSSALQSQLKDLRAQSINQSNALDQLQVSVSSSQASSQVTNTAMISQSEVLDAAIPLHYSPLKHAVEYALAGLIALVALGMGFAVIRALVQDRLRRRDDVADALGAPVRLSTRSVPARRRLPQLPWRAASRDGDIMRIVAYLRGVVPGSRQGPATLAIVAVDNAPAVARIVVSLAASYAGKGKQVLVADLSRGYELARLLGEKKPGIHDATTNGVRLRVLVPERDDIVPFGPIRSGTSPADHERPNDGLISAYASADILLSLVTLDPASGGDHLRTWAADSVAIVTAGHSSGTAVRAAGEMVRLAGMRLVSGLLLGADKKDESLGVAQAQDHFLMVGPAHGAYAARSDLD